MVCDPRTQTAPEVILLIAMVKTRQSAERKYFEAYIIFYRADGEAAVARMRRPLSRTATRRKFREEICEQDLGRNEQNEASNRQAGANDRHAIAMV